MFTFLIGLLILLYPLISRAYYDTQYRLEANKIKKEFQINTSNYLEVYNEYLSYNQRSVIDISDIEVADVGFIPENESNNQNIELNKDDVLAVISIPKIDVTYAIRDGATDENLMNGVARVQGTSYPVGGLNTNSVIAGHRAQSTKSLFARVPELENGDIIEIQNQKETIYYEVFGNEIIEPTDIDALAPINGLDMITLLTCTYPPPGTHRHLVFAKRTDSPFNHVEEEQNMVKLDDNQLNVNNQLALFKSPYTFYLFFSRYGLLIFISMIGLYGFYVIYLKKKS